MMLELEDESFKAAITNMFKETMLNEAKEDMMTLCHKQRITIKTQKLFLRKGLSENSGVEE